MTILARSCRNRPTSAMFAPDAENASPTAPDSHLCGAWSRASGKPANTVQLHRFREIECWKSGSSPQGRVSSQKEEAGANRRILEPEVPTGQGLRRLLHLHGTAPQGNLCGNGHSEGPPGTGKTNADPDFRRAKPDADFSNAGW